jgi:hypothetical protein
MKPGGHFCISDVVLRGNLPPSLQTSTEMYAGCVAGALQEDDYLDVIKNAGFREITIMKMKVVEIPEDVLKSIATPREIDMMKTSNAGIYSITVVGNK